jgi:hypothetical protein
LQLNFGVSRMLRICERTFWRALRYRCTLAAAHSDVRFARNGVLRPHNPPAMATVAEETTNYPSLPARHWWTLRERFKRSLPGNVTPTYLETALNVDAKTARGLVAQLRYLGLVDTEGRPTDTAEDWRHDDTYAKACEEIKSRVYPDELHHAVPDATADRAAVERWFARKKKVGANRALKLAITYQLVSEADLTKAPDAPGSVAKKNGEHPSARAEKPARRRAGAPAEQAPTSLLQSAAEAPKPPQSDDYGPSLHIDVQIHIAADASAAQIDQIFASMAKHLYSRGAQNA